MPFMQTIRASIKLHGKTQKSTAQRAGVRGNLRSARTVSGDDGEGRQARPDDDASRRSSERGARERPAPMTGFADQSARHRTMARSLCAPPSVQIAARVFNNDAPSATPLTRATLLDEPGAPQLRPVDESRRARPLPRRARRRRHGTRAALLRQARVGIDAHLFAPLDASRAAPAAMGALADAVVGELDEIRAITTRGA